MPWTHQLINPHFHNHTLPETHGTSHLKRWYHTDPEKEAGSLEPMNFQGRSCSAGGQWWWSHRMSWIRGCLWCTGAGGSARNPWDAANPTAERWLGKRVTPHFWGKSEVAQLHNLAAHVDRITTGYSTIFHMKGWFTFYNPVYEKAKKKTLDRFGSFVLEVGRCFVSKRYWQGFRLVNDDDNCDPKSL